MVEAGIAKKRGKKIFRADGTQITDDVHTIEIGQWFNQRILHGTLDPADPTMNGMGWTKPVMEELWEEPAVQPETSSQQESQKVQSAQTVASAPSYQTVRLTFYYVPHADEARFGGNEALLKENGKLQNPS